MTPQQTSFLKTVIPAALACEKLNPVPPACITIAQAILESGWGKASIGNNLWGIKCYDPKTPTNPNAWGCEERQTFEYVNGVKTPTVAKFQLFPTPLDAVQQHAAIFKHPDYLQLRAALSVSGWRGFAQLLGPQVDSEGHVIPGQPPRYSTAPTYGAEIITLVEDYGLDDQSALARIMTA